ncbi:MAG: PAF1 complex [Trebouxia sp. A1-2]|nr:MAG: PAF1 complex [Trebouxia sp. A1-2]
MDPLSALREFVVAGRLQEVVAKGDRIQFGDKYSFAKRAPTSYQSGKGTGEFYPLETLAFWVQWEQQHPEQQGFSAYFQAARKQQAGNVAVADRQDLKDFLTGVVRSSQYIRQPEINLTGLPLQQEADEALQEPSFKRQRVEEGSPEGEAAVLHHALTTERKLRDRNSQLVVPNKSFARVRTICEQQLHLMRQPQQKQHHLPSSATPSARASTTQSLVKPSGRLEREVAPDLGLGGAAQLGIKLGSQVKPAAAQTPSQPSSSSRPPSSSHRPHSQPSTSGRSDQQAAAPQHRSKMVKGTPIILVPPGETATITMWNAKAFLEQGQYESMETSRQGAAAAGRGKLPKDRIHRSVGRARPIRYEITDRAPSDKATWDRVVALFCLGKAWQFKAYPKALFPGCDVGDTVALFSRVLGVYLHMTDEEVPADVKKWNVKILRLNRQNRHTDMAEAGHFYSELDKHLNANPAKAATLAF